MNRKNRLKDIATNYDSIVYKAHKLFTSLGLREDPDVLALSLSIASKLKTWTTCEGRPGFNRFKALSNACIRAIMGLRLEKDLDYKVPGAFLRTVVISRNSHLESLY